MKLTVLIPIFNTKPDALLEAVYSILDQDDGTKHDIILIDDASDRAETREAINCLVNVRHEAPITLLSLDQNSGTSVALNKGHELVRTDYVAIMGSDDVSDRSRFRKQINFLKDNPAVDVLGTNLFMFKDGDMRRTAYFTSSHSDRPKPTSTHGHWIVNHGTVIYKNEKVKSVGGYNPALRRAQDIDLWSRMYPNCSFRNLTEVLYAWRRFK